MDEAVFDGAAISRADREFLASLDDSPAEAESAVRDAVPAAARFRAVRPDGHRTRPRRGWRSLRDVVTWMLANYAYREGAFMGKGGAISLVDGEVITLADLRGRMAPVGAAPHRPARRPQDALAGRRLDGREGPALDPPRGDAARPAAADLRGGRLCDLQPLPAAGASGGGRRSCGLRRLLRPPHPGRRGTGLDVALARPQGAPAVDTDGRRDHGRRRVRLGPRHPVRHPGARCSARTTSRRARSGN